MAKVSPEIVKKFFTSLRKLTKELESSSEAEVEALVEAHPDLLECECPTYDPDNDNKDDEEWLEEGEGLLAVEIMCEEGNRNASGRDTLCLLVELGAQATDSCYEEIIGGYDSPHDYAEALLLSGYMPVAYPGHGNAFFLDELVDGCDYPEEVLGGCLQLLHPERVKEGDQFGFGKIKAHMVERLQNLPKLKAGVTYEKGGSFDELLTEWRKDLEEEEDDKDNDKEGLEKIEEEAPKKKKQRC